MVCQKQIDKLLSGFRSPNDNNGEFVFLILMFCLIAVCLYLVLGDVAWADSGKLPGTDASGQLEAAGTLLRIIDTGLFKWGARIFAGLCIMSSGWALKEQRFGIAIICVIGAIIFGTAPTWVKNIFEIGGGGGVFSLMSPRRLSQVCLSQRWRCLPCMITRAEAPARQPGQPDHRFPHHDLRLLGVIGGVHRPLRRSFVRGGVLLVGNDVFAPYARTVCDAGDSVEEQSRDFLSLAIPAPGLGVARSY